MAATTVLQRGPASVLDYRGGWFELVAGSILIGHPGDEFTCSHEHVYGDECLSFELRPALVESLGERPEVWRTGCLPPLPARLGRGQLPCAGAAGGGWA